LTTASWNRLRHAALAFCATASVLAVPAFASSVGTTTLTPDNLVLTRSIYSGIASTVTIGEPLPPNCPSTAACGTGTATNNGLFPSLTTTNNVWNNDLADGSFGVTSPIFIDEITTSGTVLTTISVPPATLVTSFSSKSELSVNLSLDRQFLTLMGYVAGENTLDVSNSNTPGVYDPTNPVGNSYYRAVLQIDTNAALQVTETDAYSGNNGRAAILNNGVFYTVGNSNNGSGTPANVVASAGVQIFAATPGQVPVAPTELGIFSITQVTNPATGTPYAADKLGKDNNFRGLTVFNNTVYVSKGSGSNGINTVYQVGSPGTLPALTDAPNAPIKVLPGFPVTLAKAASAANPFGLWFADVDTLYVADEGDGTAADAATSAISGLQKWLRVNGTWQRAYVLQNGLNLGVPYGIPNYPTSLNPVTDGLRNITGRVNADGTVTIWGVTSTVSANGDQGADPNKLVTITDTLAFSAAGQAAAEQFTTLRTAVAGEVLRGVSFTPNSLIPLPVTVTTSGLLYSRRTQTFTGTLTVTNNRPSTINGPVTVVLTGLTSGVTLVGSTTVNGAPALAIPGTSTLASGQSVSVTVQFQDPSLSAITFTPAVIN
jgi:hypothetical protein